MEKQDLIKEIERNFDILDKEIDTIYENYKPEKTDIPVRSSMERFIAGMKQTLNKAKE